MAPEDVLVEGDPGLAIVIGGKARTVFDFVIEAGRITEISLIAEARVIAALRLDDRFGAPAAPVDRFGADGVPACRDGRRFPLRSAVPRG